MAFRDQNGKITIDEIAAQQDIQNMTKSRESLVEAIDHIKQIQAGSTGFQGETGVVLQEQCAEFIQMLNQQIENIDRAIDAISKTVARYQEIDRQLKDQIQS